MRIVREERRLVYHAQVFTHVGPDGGCWGFLAGTAPESTDQLVAAFWDVIRSEQARADEWDGYVQDAIRAIPEMRVLNPHEIAEEADHCLVASRRVLSDAEYVSTMTQTTREELTDMITALTPEHARTFVFRGTGEAA